MHDRLVGLRHQKGVVDVVRPLLLAEHVDRPQSTPTLARWALRCRGTQRKNAEM